MRILMLGNSFTFANHMPDTLAKLIGAEVVHHTRGGARLAEQLNEKTKMGKLTQNALRNEKWDYVVLQEMSNGPITSKKKFLQNVELLCKQISGCSAVPILYATWAYERGSKQLESLGMGYDEMHQQMYASYHEAAELTGALIADVGQRFYEIADREKIYASDGCHPNETGSMIVAETIAEVIREDQKEKNTNNTIAYYNKNALNFIRTTQPVDFHEIQELFLSYLPEKSKILDFGCGSGRDAKYFLDHGYDVVAVDGSEEICKAASKYIGTPVKQMLFQDLDEKNTYDGIWSCASILHISKIELPDMFQRMREALKQNGIMYISFKHGTFEGIRNGRYFTDLTEQSFSELLGKIKGLKIEKIWLNEDVRENRGNEQWLNIILQKVDIN